MSDALTRMLAGPDGSSLKCGFCGFWDYVAEQPDGLVVCAKCRHMHHWSPEKTCCANPKHNTKLGCGSPVCWNRRSDLL